MKKQLRKKHPAPPITRVSLDMTEDVKKANKIVRRKNAELAEGLRRGIVTLDQYAEIEPFGIVPDLVDDKVVARIARIAKPVVDENGLEADTRTKKAA